MGEINVYDKNVTENLKKEKVKIETKEILHGISSKWWFWNGIHSALIPEGAMILLSLFEAYRSASRRVRRQKLGHA